MKKSRLATKIQQVFNERLRGPFPLEDVRSLRALDPDNITTLHGQLEKYFSCIAGYASSSVTLGRRSKTELFAAQEQLSRPFFEQHPELVLYKNGITPERTPKLFEELGVADKIRSDLLVVIAELLRSQG